jgi:hypothetical protein
MDPGRHYALVYAEILDKEGFQVKTDAFKGLIHAFWTFFPGAEFS